MPDHSRDRDELLAARELERARELETPKISTPQRPRREDETKIAQFIEAAEKRYHSNTERTVVTILLVLASILIVIFLLSNRAN